MTEGLSDEFYDKWQHLLDDIEMSEVPLPFVREISVNLTDGSKTIFDIGSMLGNGNTVREIETAIEDYLSENDSSVSNIDFHIDIQAVADTVTDRVSKILDK